MSSTERDPSRTTSETDSFDDEEEDYLAPDSIYSVSNASSNYALFSRCPICFEIVVLQSSVCCTFYCCHTCWFNHISSVIHNGRIKIPCISNECHQYLSRDMISNLIRNDSLLYEKYLKLYTNANQTPRAKTCPHCSHLFNLDSRPPIILLKSKKTEKKPPKKVQCTECSFVWCFRCSAPWHENLTCKQFTKGDKLLSDWIKQTSDDQWNARKCPSCSSVIQRAGGCPHMTCSSCSCEFCYLCGRRYSKIPLIGQHSNKFSVLGCPYNLHPEKPWLRRTIRGVIATGVLAVSPLIAAGALTIAVTVLPPIGIYKAVKHVRRRRRREISSSTFPRRFNEQEEAENNRFAISVEEFERFREEHRIIARREVDTNDFPLAIFADMDVENLFVDNERSDSISDDIIVTVY